MNAYEVAVRVKVAADNAAAMAIEGLRKVRRTVAAGWDVMPATAVEVHVALPGELTHVFGMDEL